jgi:hypothetical protein
MARRSFYVIDIVEILVHWYAGRRSMSWRPVSRWTTDTSRYAISVPHVQ